jgi:ferredoxin
LRELLARQLARSEVRHAPATGPLLARPIVDRGRCEPCPLCAASCPTGALRFSSLEDEHELKLRPQACTACGACEPVCPHDALSVAAEIDLAEWGRGLVSLARSRSDSCRMCGEVSLSTAIGLCSRCYRTSGGGAF